VGWYHSHTRSEISLSVQDLEIHNRYFPEPWQVALEVRPHALQPMRAGFLFREAGSAIHAESSYREFLLPLAAPVSIESGPPVDIPLPAFPSPPPPRRSRQFPGPTHAESSHREFLLPLAVPVPIENGPPVDIPLPAFLCPPPPRRSRQWPWYTVIVMALGAALFALATLFTLRTTWMPALEPHQSPSVSLLAYDIAGQLQIRWDRTAELCAPPGPVL
jgi:hypothetical protein